MDVVELGRRPRARTRGTGRAQAAVSPAREKSGSVRADIFPVWPKKNVQATETRRPAAEARTDSRLTPGPGGSADVDSNPG